jgi:nucleoid-associated protein YgaU
MVGALLLVAVGHVRGATGGLDSVSTAPLQIAVVRPGDTLWGLALRYAPARSRLRPWIAETEHLNGLSDAALHPGQVIRLPAR